MTHLASTPLDPTSDAADRERFAARHIGITDDDATHMLKVIGSPDLAQLLEDAVPSDIRATEALQVPAAVGEDAVLAELRTLADQNTLLTSYIGQGYHGTITPPVIQRNVLENPAWYTAYTPYQPEISQGRLQALLNFQTMIAELTGMDIANASLLDEGTAAAEAMTLSKRANRRNKGNVFVVDAGCHPQTIAVVQTRATPIDIEVVVMDPRAGDLPEGTFGVLLQQPTTTGALHNDADLISRCHDATIHVVVAADLLACVLVTPPGEQGADVVVGTSQRFGVPMMFGGPHAGYIAVREDAARSLPGRLVGVSIDREGRPANRLALQTREQHIRREKATSNICTSQVLLAVVAGLYAMWHGPDGLARIARRVHGHTAILAAGLRAAGFVPVNDTFLDTITVPAADVEATLQAARDAGYNLRRVDADHVGIAFDETTTAADVDAVLGVFGAVRADGDVPVGIPSEMRRTTPVLEHPVFDQFHTETEMMRLLRNLADKDIALDRSMIPLGSCTMKLNAAAEMASVTWPEFAGLHPFVPQDQAAGSRRLIADLEAWLADITGYDAVSLQPNAGSQGEYAGLLAIRSYHLANGDGGRTVCLIPSSAHGTNAASAVMAGMSVVVVACDDQGNVDLEDLERLVVLHSATLAALMVTYPSTHGVFEREIQRICGLVHDNGGQVYLDGANLNALVGLARPGHFGSDVSHLNLHKTFCIPHGGGGPGVGPIGVRSHLAPYLPNHPEVADAGPATGPGPVSAAPFGSAGVLQIPWAYLRLMGPDGLTDATGAAILSANYLAVRLAEHYPVLYTGPGGRVAHECIIDVRGIAARTGIDNEDVAKRLIDYGFHAPTMSFPVAGTLMIEPTESEALVELDRFLDAMIGIRGEIARVEAGEWPADDNPLVNAPHTAEAIGRDEWTHPYGREIAAWPASVDPAKKYWAPVARIDNAHGDRNLMCSCPPMDLLADTDA